jgi:DNA-binding beta-propeller fold protein YncE
LIVLSHEIYQGTAESFGFPTGISISPDGSFALVAATYEYLIHRIEISTREMTTLAGNPSYFDMNNYGANYGFVDGVGTNAVFCYPFGVNISPTGLFALVADTGNHAIRYIDLSTRSVSTLAGNPGGANGFANGIGSNVIFNNPQTISISPDGRFALVSDQYNKLIRRIDIRPKKYSFGVLFGGHGVLSPGYALLVDYYFVSDTPGTAIPNDCSLLSHLSRQTSSLRCLLL